MPLWKGKSKNANILFLLKFISVTLSHCLNEVPLETGLAGHWCLKWSHNCLQRKLVLTCEIKPCNFCICYWIVSSYISFALVGPFLFYFFYVFFYFIFLFLINCMEAQLILIIIAITWNLLGTCCDLFVCLECFIDTE